MRDGSPVASDDDNVDGAAVLGNPLTSVAHLRLLASIAGLGSLRIDRALGLATLDASAAMHHLLVPSIERTIPIDLWLSSFSEADRLRIHSILQAGLPDGRVQCANVRLRWAADGEPPALELSFGLDADAGHIVCATRDITAAQSIEEVRRHRAAAERASRAKSEFMSQVSHELRTPLNSILGFAQLMSMDAEHPLAEKQQERLRVLHHSGKRLLTLVDQLLQIGKIEQGKGNLKTKSVGIRSMVQRCVATMVPMAEERDISMEIDIEGDGSGAVRADAHALEQVLLNLLSNAIKYNRHGGKVRVKYRAPEAGEITVDDTGPGLAPSQIAQLFEPFNRLGAGGAGIPGTGLGLVISRQLVEAMNGSLEVWSEVGVGTRFRIALPRARTSKGDDGHTLPIGMPSQWSSDDQFRVLYIEDDDVNVVLLDQIFATRSDWTLIVAMNGANGIAEAIRQQPDLILLDLMLPDMSGWEVLKRLKQDRRTREIPVIAVSADAMAPNLRRSRASGLVDYWTKPLELPAVIRQLKALSGARVRRQM